MRNSLALAALMVGLSVAAPAVADAPAGFGRGPLVGHRPPPPRYAPPRHYGYGAPRHRHHGHGGHYGYRAGPAVGPLPPFFSSHGDAAAHLEGAPVGLTLYREAYIGRGLIYNTPPTLDRPGLGYGPVLSARY